MFDEKRVRAAEYKQHEAGRKVNNHYWTAQIDPSCGLLEDTDLIYFCVANGRYYEVDKTTNKQQYRELSTTEVKKTHVEKD